MKENEPVVVQDQLNVLACQCQIRTWNQMWNQMTDCMHILLSAFVLLITFRMMWSCGPLLALGPCVSEFQVIDFLRRYLLLIHLHAV